MIFGFTRKAKTEALFSKELWKISTWLLAIENYSGIGLKELTLFVSCASILQSYPKVRAEPFFAPELRFGLPHFVHYFLNQIWQILFFENILENICTALSQVFTFIFISLWILFWSFSILFFDFCRLYIIESL